MSFPKFYVTYGVMNTDAGANPFGHSFIMFSKQHTENGPVVVDDCVGFYSQPNTATDPFINAIKHLLGFKVDLQDGHGILRKEKMHELDGNGIQGRSFEVREDKFSLLKRLCEEQNKNETDAIRELDKKIKGERRESNGQTRFKEEKALAALEKRQPRLHPFHVQMDMTLYGLDSSASHTCKTRALNLLEQAQIIDKESRKELEGGQAGYAFPRFSGETLPPIRFVSTGDSERIEARSTARVFYNRGWENKNTLFFASPLNLSKPKPSESRVYESVKAILTHTRNIEIKLHQAIESTENHTRKNSLQEQLKRVQGLYNEFNNAHNNELPDYLSAKRALANNYLNIATLSLSPERVNYSFAFRAFESICVRHALLGLMGVLLAAAFFSGAIGVTLCVGTAIYTTYNLYEFYKEEAKFAEMQQDYVKFQAEKGHHEISMPGIVGMHMAVPAA